jgi:carbon monoxide dehydrogenase subunit G
LKVSGSHTVPAERERTYRLLQDPEVLAKCMPGCDRLDRVGENNYRMKMKMMIGGLSGLFDGSISIANAQPPQSFRLKVTGNGKIGFVDAEGALNLEPHGATTEVKYDGEVQVGGTIASIGQRLLDGASRMIIKRFFENLAREAASAGQSPVERTLG